MQSLKHTDADRRSVGKKTTVVIDNITNWTEEFCTL